MFIRRSIRIKSYYKTSNAWVDAIIAILCWFWLLFFGLKSIQCRWFFKGSSFIHFFCSCLFSSVLHCLSNFFLQKTQRKTFDTVYTTLCDWLTQRWLARYYSPSRSQRETKWLFYFVSQRENNCSLSFNSARVVYTKATTVFWGCWINIKTKKPGNRVRLK